MGHVLTGTLQKFFMGRTSTGAKIGQLLANNLIIAPIQTFGTFVNSLFLIQCFGLMHDEIVIV